MIIKNIFNFKGGIKIKRNRPLYNYPVASLPAPEKVVLPLVQQPGVLLKPLVTKEKDVLIGQKIAESDEKTSAPLHASVSGRIIDISEYIHPLTGEKVDSIVIENNGKDDKKAPHNIYSDYFRYTPSELLSIIKDAGIIGLGGEAFSAHIKLNKGKKDLDSLIVNAVESDPELSCDDALIRENAKTIIDGIKIVMYIFDISNAIIAVRNDNLNAIKIFQALTFHEPNMFIALVSSKYPQGEERLLIKTIIGKDIGLNDSSYSAGVVVSNVATIYAIARALKHGENLFSRIITVSCSGKGKSGNYWVRNGMLAKDIALFCGINEIENTGAIFGGIMRGRFHDSLEIPVIKANKGIFLLDKKSVIDYKNFDCIRCGCCIKSCPVNILPNKISTFVQEGKTEILKKYGVDACIECGCCSYVCPSYRPIFEHIQIAKKELERKNDARKFTFHN